MLRSLSIISLLCLAACGDSTGPGRRVFAQVSAGAFHACGLTRDGVAWCWGDNTYGALGDGTTERSPVPVRVAGSIRFTTITAGLDHTCALAPNGGAWCWGINLTGQLGTGSATDMHVPTAVSSSSAWRAVSAGEGHTCATTTLTASCWGASLGPAADGTVHDPVDVPTTLAGPALPVVSVGYEIACGLGVTGSAKCWGLQPPGVVLTNGRRATDTPTAVSGTTTFTAISAGHKHACGLDAGGASWCWGLNPSGQVGNGSTGDTVAAPAQVLGGHHFTRLDAHGPGHTCAVDEASAAWCWGGNAFGQLGDGSRALATQPVPVVGGLRFVSISVGFHFTCGVAAGEVWCWGYGGLGQIGDGAALDRVRPTRVAEPRLN